MPESGGPLWQVDIDTSPAMLLALFLRDLAGLGTVGNPALCPARPAVPSADPHQLLHNAGGPAVLRVEWETWWYQLVSNENHRTARLSPPDFPEFESLPALRLLAHAHYGTAMTWTQEREAEYAALSQARIALGRQKLFEQLVEERELELGRSARSFQLQVIELPLSETRAWFVEPSKLIMSQDLHENAQVFRSYVQPVVELLA